MDTYEHKGRLTYKDENGDLHRLYPVTKAECVEGLVVGESVLYTPQDLTDEQKAQARENIGVSSDISLPDVSSEDEGKVLKVVDGEWKVGEIGASEAPDTNHPVTSVNGMTGDVIIDIPEVGVPEKVQADWNQNDPTQPDYIKNRTHWGDSQKIEIVISDPSDILDTATYEGDAAFYKISDETPQLDDFLGATITTHAMSTVDETTQIDEVIIEESKVISSEAAPDGSVAVLLAPDLPLYIAYSDSLVVDGINFPSKGIYAVTVPVDDSFENGGIRIVYESGSLCKLDPKFLPDGGFGYEEDKQNRIEWDGVTEGLTAVDTYGDGSNILYRISELTPDIETCIGARMRTSLGESFMLNGDFLRSYDWGCTIVEAIYVINKTECVIGGHDVVFPSPGIYTNNFDGEYLVELVLNSTTTHKIDPKFLPEGSAGWQETGCAVTWDSAQYPVPVDPIEYASLVKLSDDVPSDGALFNGFVTFYGSGDVLGRYIIGDRDLRPYDSTAVSTKVYVGETVVFVIHRESVTVSDGWGGTKVYDPGIYFSFNGTSVYVNADHISLSYGGGSGKIHTIDEKFIPDTIARKSDILSGGGIDESILMEAVESALQESKESGMFDGADGVTYIPAMRSDGYLEWSNTAGAPNPAPAKVKGDSGKSAYAYAQEGGYTGTEEEFAEMLASGTGGGGGLPLPPAAAVGQFIVVSAVDENGKVTATEAITLEDAEEVAF